MATHQFCIDLNIRNITDLAEYEEMTNWHHDQQTSGFGLHQLVQFRVQSDKLHS